MFTDKRELRANFHKQL